MIVHIANFGMGNVGSIANMIRKVGGDAIVTNEPDAIATAGMLVLPGVGSFDQGMRALATSGIREPLVHAAVTRGVPVLGICLGMQLMMNRSEEGSLPGLGFVPGDVRRFPSGPTLPRVPHMGWNRVAVRKSSPLFVGEEERRYYFVHSYYVSCAEREDVLATTAHGLEFVSAFHRGNLFGVQFHPEKSHRFGMDLFRRFLELGRC